MLRCVTVRELSIVLAFCRFCRFLIYISARFIYISFTFSFPLFFSFLPAKTTPCHFCLAICAICGKSLILNSFFLPKRLPKLAISASKKLSH